jgi:histidinol-phosphate aminotransferase
VRLHLNENTAGCSPAVLAALGRLGRSDAGFYPDYDAARAAVAHHFNVPGDFVLLTNGLDEGILAAIGAAFRGRSGGVPETLGVVPAFDMYEILTTALGGRMVTAPLRDDFAFDREAFVAAVTPATKIAFVTNPHNPSGRFEPIRTFIDVAREIAPVILFLDEAYADFAGDSAIDAGVLASHPNLLVGRTFSKSYGLAGLRAGAVIGTAPSLEPLRNVVPPYSVNAWAAAALPVALKDDAYRAWYCAQAAASRELIAGACSRLGLRTWPSAANFALVRIGDRAPDVVRELAARGVRVRDRSTEPGCGGCIRVTAGVVDDTRRAIEALTEVVCAAR